MPIQSQLLPQRARWRVPFLILCFTFLPSFSLGQGNPPFEWYTLYPRIRDRLISKERSPVQTEGIGVVDQRIHLSTLAD